MQRTVFENTTRVLITTIKMNVGACTVHVVECSCSDKMVATATMHWWWRYQQRSRELGGEINL